MSTRLIVVLATAGIVIVGVLVGSVGAEQTALPAGNLVKNPGAEAGPGATTTAQRSGETATFNPPGVDNGPVAGEQ